MRRQNDRGVDMPKVLIAEDDLMTADRVEETLVKHGYEVCGIARTVADAVALGRCHKPELAVIDLRLADGGLGTEIVTQLSELGRLGVLYATANLTDAMMAVLDGDACLAKPYRDSDLVRGLEIVADIVANRMASQPFPHGFHLLPPPTVTRPEFTF
jgi:ActR/RegA family two-component response regulator